MTSFTPDQTKTNTTIDPLIILFIQLQPTYSRSWRSWRRTPSGSATSGAACAPRRAPSTRPRCKRWVGALESVCIYVCVWLCWGVVARALRVLPLNTARDQSINRPIPHFLTRLPTTHTTSRYAPASARGSCSGSGRRSCWGHRGCGRRWTRWGSWMWGLRGRGRRKKGRGRGRRKGAWGRRTEVVCVARLGVFGAV